MLKERLPYGAEHLETTEKVQDANVKNKKGNEYPKSFGTSFTKKFFDIVEGNLLAKSDM
jgi:hypothetical protein